VPSSLLFELTRELGAIAGEESGRPSAILITRRAVPQDLERFSVSSELEAAAFRVEAPETCQRYFLAEGFDLATMYTVAPLLLPSEFPAVSSKEFKIQNLAEAILEELEAACSGFKLSDPKGVSANIESALAITAEVFKSASSFLDAPWNVEWLEFVQEASNALLEKASGFSSEDEVKEASLSFFGLPSSGYPSAWRGDYAKTAHELLTAFDSFWGSRSEVDKSVEFIQARFGASSSDRLLAGFSGARFESLASLFGASLVSCIRALSKLAIETVETSKFFPVSDFISPRSKDEKRGTISIHDSDDKPLGFGKSLESSPFLVTVDASGFSPELLVRIPLNDEYLDSADLIGEIAVMPNISGTKFQVDSIGQSEGDIVLLGRFALDDEPLAELGEFSFLKASLGYDLSAESKLVGLLPSSSRCSFVFARSWGASYVLLSDPAAKSLAKAEAWSFADAPQEVEVSGNQRALAMVVFGVEPELDSKPISRFGPDGFFKVTTSVGNRMHLSSSGSHIHLFTPEELDNHESPILAAAFKEGLSTSRPALSNQLSIRGRLEELLAKGVANAGFMDSNFHVAIAEDMPLEADGLSSEYLLGIVSGRPVAGMMQEIPFEVDKEFYASPEVARFKEAFQNLGVSALMQNPIDGSSEWPSKISWRKLFEEPSGLNSLLDAFAAMMRASEEYGHASKFWAAYPFSTSIWNMDEQLCSAVLLSPLHPLRLAWLASVEHGLWQTADAQNFMGVIEGWNFPYIGPGIFAASSMVAIPTDLGDDNLFAGWSMLVPIPGGQPSPLVGPATAAGLPAPGASATGFNASTAKSALRAFRKINNHLNDFVVDLGLSQNKSSPRLSEVDAAVIDEAEILLSSKELYGGVHVYDSSKRTGLPPYQRLHDVALRSYPKPFSWSVYEDSAAVQVRSHIKMLQDPGLKIQISRTGAAATASLPTLPFKRFMGAVPEKAGSVGETVLVPKIDPYATSWTEFAAALSTLESFAYGDQIVATLQLSALTGGDSEWTVSGEGMIGPAAIMSLLSSSPNKNTMLWEWRPPFLNSKSMTQELSRRPYFAIAKIPSSFRSQIANKVLKALPTEADSARIATKALELLGGRGMGLSGLMSMGSTHTTGALGFFAAFDLLDQVVLPDGQGLIVLPVDACEPFIETLSGQKTLDLKKRADLLAIVFSEESAVLIPIEVKLIGLDSESTVAPTLPSPSSKALDEATSQADSTSKSLSLVVENSRKFLTGLTGFEGDLWRTNLASLLDAGSKLTKLSGPHATKLSKLLGRVLNGIASIELGASVITYFHAATSDGAGRSWLAQEVPSAHSMKPNRILVCSIGLALSSTTNKDALLKDWNLLFASAVREASVGFDRPRVQITPTEQAEAVSPVESDPEPTTTAPSVELDHQPTSLVLPVESDPEPSSLPPAGEATADLIDDSSFFANGGDGHRTTIGYGTDGQAVSWDPSSLNHGVMMGVVGNPGMGKTQLVLSALQDFSMVRNPDGTPTAIFIFDFKGEFSALDAFNSRHGFDVIKVTDPVPFDIWALPEASKNEKALGHKIIQICDTMQSIYNIGPNQRFRLSGVLLDQYMKRGFASPSLSDIAEGYARARGSNPADTIDSILNQFKLTGAFNPDRSNGEPPAMQDYLRQGKKVIDFQLDQIASPEIVKFYATVILNEYNQLMMTYPNQTEFPKNLRVIRSMLVIDEAHNLMQHRPKSLDTIQTMGRSKGFALLLASQQLKHYRPDPATNYAVLMDTWAIFSCSGLTKADLNAIGAAPDTSQQLLAAVNQLTQGQAAFLTVSNKRGLWGDAEQHWKRRGREA
jgi:hypothetical protein